MRFEEAELDTTEVSRSELNTNNRGATELDTTRRAYMNSAGTESAEEEITLGRQQFPTFAAHAVSQSLAYEMPAEDVPRPELEGSQPRSFNSAVRRKVWSFT